MMLITNVAIPWLVLWNPAWRRNPVILFTVGLLINVGMWAERYIIVPVSLQINRMPFMWGQEFRPGIEVPIFIGTVAFFILLPHAGFALPAAGAGVGSAGRPDGALHPQVR